MYISCFSTPNIAIGANNYCKNITCTNSGFTLNEINEGYTDDLQINKWINTHGEGDR